MHKEQKRLEKADRQERAAMHKEQKRLEKAGRQEWAAERRLQAPHSYHPNRAEDSGLGGRESIIGATTRGYELTRGEPPGGKPNPVWSIGTETRMYDGSVWLRLNPAYAGSDPVWSIGRKTWTGDGSVWLRLEPEDHGEEEHVNP